MTVRVPRNGVPEQRSHFLQKGTERDHGKGTERGKERRSKFRGTGGTSYFAEIFVGNCEKMRDFFQISNIFGFLMVEILILWFIFP